MKFDILNRYSGEVQLSAEIDCSADALPSLKLGLAVKWAVKESANLYGANLYGADLRSANLYGANLRSANLRSANLYGADLRSANLYGADLRSANLRSANLYGADLRSANLYGADLYGADLRSADLYGADLRSANLVNQPIIDGGIRSDGYRFMLTNFPQDGVLVLAGCRRFAPQKAVEHWTQTRGDSQLGKESLQLVEHMMTLAKIRGWSV